MRRTTTRARTAVFAPLGDAGRAVRVEQRLDQAIRSGILADGERLPSEPELAAMLGVATVTAREALERLRAQGLVTTTRGRGGGSFVTRPTGRVGGVARERLLAMTRVELADRGTHYATLLAGCAELAAERADAEEVAELRQIVLFDDSGAEAGDARHADTELHLAVSALTHSARLAREVIRMEAEFGVLLRLPFDDPGHRDTVRAHQGALIDAIAAGDAELARSRMRVRVREAVGDLAEILRASAT